MNATPARPVPALATLNRLSTALGLTGLGIAPLDLTSAGDRLQHWLAQNYHGTMGYMAKHGAKRWRPDQLIPGTLSAVMVRLNYLPEPQERAWQQLQNPAAAYISRYALGRDYHKVLKQKLEQLATALQAEVGPFGYRVFVDSGPVLEKPLAELAGLGWIGKHTNLIDREAGSWFFIGTLFTDLPLPPAQPTPPHCGTCQRCLTICPTAALIAPYQLDARRCISYLTIEHHGAIPIELRRAIGNRIYGCDDCQLICPWNRTAPLTEIADFAPRHGLDTASLLELFQWSEVEFNRRSEGMALRRIGYERWQRNLAVALGNAPPNTAIQQTLQRQLPHASPLVAEHIAWALAQ